MNAIMLTVAVATVAVIPLARRWPYQVIIIDLAGQTVSLAWAISTGSGFFTALSASLIGVLLVLLFYLGGRGRRRPVPKVIGDESRRLRDALVRALRERAAQPRVRKASWMSSWISQRMQTPEPVSAKVPR